MHVQNDSRMENGELSRRPAGHVLGVQANFLVAVWNFFKGGWRAMFRLLRKLSYSAE
jgi:hypothetical protein